MSKTLYMHFYSISYSSGKFSLYIGKGGDHISKNTIKKATNSKKKGKPRGKSFGKGTGPNRNPRITGKSRPSNGQLWSEQFAQIGELKAEEIVEMVGNNTELGKKISKLPKNIQIKSLLAVANMTDAILDPNNAKVLRELLGMEAKLKMGADSNLIR